MIVLQAACQFKAVKLKYTTCCNSLRLIPPFPGSLRAAADLVAQTWGVGGKRATHLFSGLVVELT
jgi:hypothetical protein